MTPQEYLDALLQLPALGWWGAKISPDGKWVAWTWFRTAPTAEVYIAPTDGSQPPQRMTDTPENTLFVSWTPDSQALLVAQDTGGDERVQIFRVALESPLLMTPITEASPNYYIRHPQLHPNGDYLTYAANVDDTTGAEIEPSCIYRQDLRTGERKLLARPHKATYVHPLLSPTGEYVLYNRKELHPSGDQMWLVDIEGTQDREILNFGADKKANADWFPDGKRLIVTEEKDTYTRVGIYTLADGSLHWLIDDPNRNIEQAFVPPRSSQVVIGEVQQAKPRYSLVDPDTGTETHMPNIPGNLVLVAPVSDTDWIGIYRSSQQPPDIVRFALDAMNPANFTSIARVWERTTLIKADLTQAENFTWQSVDGLTIQGWLYRPQGAARGTVVYVHGGPTGHSEDNINPQIQLFVQHGFNVLDPNYRGSTGFSISFREAIKKTYWGGLEQDDIRTGIEALIAAGIAEKGKVGITGTSYGGYSSWCAITRFPPDILAASAPICGMTDLVVDYHTTRPDLRPYSEEMLGGTPEQAPDRYHERSPIHFVNNIKGRLLIIQGMRDPNVTPENVNTVTKALQENGIEYELLAFDNEGHGIIKPKNQKVLYEALLNFFGSAFQL
jgi:dipeptidyl aminopeptidase/acylaminoacyl peptidase